jgi:DNA-3-methyladenine glycosylase I
LKIILKRCPWCLGDKKNQYYHDNEWGTPNFTENSLFEFLILEIFQTGLSWKIIINKREEIKKAFSGFDVKKIAKYDLNKINHLLNNKNIIRNKLKIESTISNAKAFIKIQKEKKSFSNYIWGFVKGKTVQNKFENQKEIPKQTKLSLIISKDLKKRGFKFIGPIVTYSFIQAIGIVNDHLTSCFRYTELVKKN